MNRILRIGARCAVAVIGCGCGYVLCSMLGWPRAALLIAATAAASALVAFLVWCGFGGE